MALLLSVFTAAAAQACTVPVFRYALERWRADNYDLVIVHRGPLSERHDTLLTKLEKRAEAGEFHANIWLTKLDVAQEDDAATAKRFFETIPEELPIAAAIAPSGAARGKVIWKTPLDGDALKAILESPARRDIAEKILKGASGVWLLLESGDKKKDEAAAKTLKDVLAEAKEQLVLPELAPGDMRYLTTGDGAPELKIDFPLISLDRNDKEEAFLIESLLRTEEDLKNDKFKGEPIAFPVYGRGRALYALVGKGINEQNIAEACIFLTGACSCQVKELNPGSDLLVSADWDGMMGGRMAVNEALPELTGFSGFGGFDIPKPEEE